MITEEVVSQFKKSLKKANMSQAEAARQMGIKSATHLNQILQGNRKPSLDLLERMAAFARGLRPTG